MTPFPPLVLASIAGDAVLGAVCGLAAALLSSALWCWHLAKPLERSRPRRPAGDPELVDLLQQRARDFGYEERPR